MRYVYNTTAGNLEVFEGPNFLRIVNLEKSKIFAGANRQADLLKWIENNLGSLNYRTLSNVSIDRLTPELIQKHLNRFKRGQEIQLAMSRRLAGAFDVLHTLVCDPYTESHYYVVKDDVTYTTAGSNAAEVEREVAVHFVKEGYYKIFRARNLREVLSPGLANRPVTEYRLVSSSGNLE